MDPITEEELKRSRRAKQYQAYQDYLDQVEGEGETKSLQVGEMQGKKVQKIASANPQIENLFNHSMQLINDLRSHDRGSNSGG